jgi:molybdopterin/thiamine biosynthesis adenylyltransferase
MRYERQLFFKYIGKEGQDKIRKSIVTIVGIGALGSVSAELLARAGIGKLILIDPDNVEIHNLQRQSLFNEEDIGKNKAEVAKDKINKINSEVSVETHSAFLDETNLDLLQSIVLDGTDNMEVRKLIDSYCTENNIPWIYGGIASSVGMTYFVRPGATSFTDIFGKLVPGLTCEGEGVLNTIAYTVASFQVTQAIKYITGDAVEEDLIRFNIWNNEFEKIKVKKLNQQSNKKEATDKTERFFISKCRNKAAYSVKSRKGEKIDLKTIKDKLDKLEIETPTAVIGFLNDEKVIIHSHEILFPEIEDMEDNNKKKMESIAELLFS